MTDRENIEDVLKMFRHKPAARVKRVVMSAYGESLAGDGRGSGGFWNRPVPLYAAAAVLVVMVGVSFLAGQRGVPSGPVRTVTEPAVPAGGAASPAGIEWSTAVNDLL